MLKFGKDIGLPDGLSAGTVGNFTIKVPKNVNVLFSSFISY